MIKRPGRPPLVAGQPSAAVHLKLAQTDYDKAYRLALAEGISVPELLRNALEVEWVLDQDHSLTARDVFRGVRARRNAERLAIQRDQIANMARHTALRAQRFRAGFIERVRRSVVYANHRGICGICGGGVDKERFHIDHIVPLAKGGQHSYRNTQPAHPKCNARKGAR